MQEAATEVHLKYSTHWGPAADLQGRDIVRTVSAEEPACSHYGYKEHGIQREEGRAV